MAFDERLEPLIVAADDSIVAVEKPARMHCAPGRSGACLCSWVFGRFPEAAAAGRGSGRADAEGGLLHRLDYETSGLVLFARSPEAFAFLLREQGEGRFRKEYILRASPSVEPRPEGSRPPRSCPAHVEAGPWSAAVASRNLSRLAELLGRAAGGPALIESAFRTYGPGAARVACLAAERPGRGAARRPAGLYRTELLSARAVEGALEISASISLGFRHQIRAHLAWIGLPILGDPLYGGLPAKRLFLHARRLRFRHPGTGRETMIEIA